MVLYICLFQNIMFAFMPEDDFGIKLKASKKLKKKNVLLNTMSPLYYLPRACAAVEFGATKQLMP